MQSVLKTDLKLFYKIISNSFGISNMKLCNSGIIIYLFQIYLFVLADFIIVVKIWLPCRERNPCHSNLPCQKSIDTKETLAVKNLTKKCKTYL